jgi:tetratricopeptide (TPR) repeat protein
MRTSFTVAAQQKTVPVPTPSPANEARADEADLFWKSKQKYFLVVAASKTAGKGNNLPFTKVDGQLISQTFIERGYEKLDLLDDRRATHDNYVKQLQRIRALPENAVVVVYYSGHAVKDPQEKDLWLQLYGQDEFGDHYGLSLSELIGAARGNTYKGDLVIILDSCYSGKGALTSSLSLREADKTVIFSSSATYQPSYSIKPPSGKEISAFTYFLLQGLGPDWAQVDGDSDGIILYSDLQTYIENKLLELLHEKAIGPMQPQLFIQTPKIWAAYDGSRARNFESQQRQILRRQRQYNVQDPEKVREMLPEILPPNSDAYLRALQAASNDQYDEAWKLFETAEGEKKVPLAEIYWARANMKMELGELGTAREWAEKALAEKGAQQNVDLIGTVALLNFGVGNWTRTEELVKQVLELIGEGKEEQEEVIISLLALTFLNAILGDKVEADLYLSRLKKIDAKVLDEQEEGLSKLVPLVDAMSDMIQNKTESARRKIVGVRQSLASNPGDVERALVPILLMVETSLDAPEGGDPTATVLPADRLREWDEMLRGGNVNRLVMLLTQVEATSSVQATAESLRSKQVEDLLKRTVDFAHKHKSAKQKLSVQTPTGTVETEIAGSEKQSLIESATLLTALAALYNTRQDVAEAEKLFKEAIALMFEEKSGAMLATNPVMRLAQLYEGAGRFDDAEKLFKNYLVKITEQMGERNFYSSMIYKKLGELYEQQERWEDAEQSYRNIAGLPQPGLEAENIIAVEGTETLATFLLNRGRYEESVKLFEQVVGWAERNEKTKSSLVDDSLGKDYFKLAQGYYHLSRYEAAEGTFKKSSDIFASRAEPDLIDDLSCIVWQWYTARALKKADETGRFYQKALRAIESDVARPHPNEYLGANLQTFASWFRDNQAYAEAEQFLRLALVAQEKAYGSGRPEVAGIWESLAELSSARRRHGDAIASLKKAQEIYAKQTPPDPDRLSEVLFKIGYAKYQRQEFEQAGVQFQESIETFRQVSKPARNNNNAVYLLGRVQRMLGRYDEARANLTALLEADEQSRRRDPLNILSDLLELTTISRAQGRFDESGRWLTRARTELEKVKPAEGTALRVKLAHEEGMLALSNGKMKQAEQLLREAVEKGEKEPQVDWVLLAEYFDDYATVLKRRDRGKEAERAAGRARQIRDSLKNGTP